MFDGPHRHQTFTMGTTPTLHLRRDGVDIHLSMLRVSKSKLGNCPLETLERAYQNFQELPDSQRYGSINGWYLEGKSPALQDIGIKLSDMILTDKELTLVCSILPTRAGNDLQTLFNIGAPIQCRVKTDTATGELLFARLYVGNNHND